MKKIGKQQEKVLAIIILLIVLVFMGLSPIIKGDAASKENAQISEVKNNLYTYTSSQDILERTMMVSQRLYIDYLIQQGTIKEVNAENVSSALLENADQLNADEKENFFQMITEQIDQEIYNNINYYIAGEDGKGFSNSDELTAIQSKEDKDYGDLLLDSWLFSFRLNAEGKQETLRTNITYPAAHDEDNSYQLYVQDNVDAHYMNQNQEKILKWKPIKNVTFVLEIPISVFVYDNIAMNEISVSYNTDDAYRYAFLKEYACFAVLLVLITITLPNKKMRESRFINFMTGNVLSVFMVLAQILMVLLAASFGPTIYYHLTLIQPLYGLFILCILYILFMPAAFLGISIKKYYLKLMKKDDKEESLFYSTIVKLGIKIRHFIERHTKIKFDDQGRNQLVMIVLFNSMILVFISFLYLLTGIGNGRYYMLLLVLYSVGVYFILRHFMKNVTKDYEHLNDEIRRMAHGELKEEVKQDLGIFEPMKESLQDLQEDFKEAVEQEVQSQRMKTELITNVSHDLKTPLTSIISYIDLLKDETLSKEEQLKYIHILESSSNRLKHLIENLFEISKANSGNVDLNLMDVDIISLLRQAEVECEAHLKKKQLQLKNHFADEKVMIKLDSQKTYRIFENLLSNVGKYALKNTRVYVIVEDFGNMVEISIKNVSEDELDFDPDEIMERFTRGDKSRNTEGSGLGLAIAKSFTELQNGVMKITTDGDLFKVSVRFYRMIEEDETNNEEEIPINDEENKA